MAVGRDHDVPVVDDGVILGTHQHAPFEKRWRRLDRAWPVELERRCSSPRSLRFRGEELATFLPELEWQSDEITMYRSSTMASFSELINMLLSKRDGGGSIVLGRSSWSAVVARLEASGFVAKN